jgi:hypothetical protein
MFFYERVSRGILYVVLNRLSNCFVGIWEMGLGIRVSGREGRAVRWSCLVSEQLIAAFKRLAIAAVVLAGRGGVMYAALSREPPP